MTRNSTAYRDVNRSHSYSFTDGTIEDTEYESPFDVPMNTHITIGVIVGVVVLVAILVLVWCLKPCATRDRRMKTASTATSIASI